MTTINEDRNHQDQRLTINELDSALGVLNFMKREELHFE
jgi:hypothetical protein